MAKTNKSFLKIAVVLVILSFMIGLTVFSLTDSAFAANEWVLSYKIYDVPEGYLGTTYDINDDPFKYIATYSEWSSSSFQPFLTYYMIGEAAGENVVPTSFTITFTNIATSAYGTATFTQTANESSGTITGVNWTKSIPSAGDYKITGSSSGSTIFGYIRCLAEAVVIQPEAYPCEEVYGKKDSQNNFVNYKTLFTTVTNGTSDIALVKYFRLDENFFYEEGRNYSYNEIAATYQGKILGWTSYNNIHLRAYWSEMVSYETIYTVGKYSFDLGFTDSNGNRIDFILCNLNSTAGEYMAELTIKPKELELPLYDETTGTGAIIMQEESYYTQNAQFPAGDPRFDKNYLRKDGSADVFSADMYAYLIEYGLDPEDLQGLFKWVPLSNELLNGGTLTKSGNTLTLRNDQNTQILTIENTGGTIINVSSANYLVSGGTTHISAYAGGGQINIDTTVSAFNIPVSFFGNVFYMEYPVESQSGLLYSAEMEITPNTKYSAAVDDSGVFSPGVGGNKILLAYITFNSQEYPILKNYFPNLPGNSSLYAQGFVDRNHASPTNEKQWLIDNKGENNYGVVLLGRLGPRKVVEAAENAGISMSGTTDEAKYLSLSSATKQAVYAYLSSAEGGNVLSGNVNNDYNALTLYQTGRAMAFYYGNGYAKGTTFTTAAGIDGVTFNYYGKDINGVEILPPELLLSISKFSGKSDYDSYFVGNILEDEDYFNEVEKNNEPYGFSKGGLSYVINPLTNETSVPFTDRSKTYITYDKAAEMGSLMKLHGASGWNNPNVIAYKVVFCRAFNESIDTSPTYDFGVFKYVEVTSTKTLTVGNYFFITEVYYGGALLPYAQAQIVYTDAYSPPTIIYQIENIKVKVVPTAFNVSPKKIYFTDVNESTISNYIQVEKPYDGRFEAFPLPGEEAVNSIGLEKYTRLYDIINAQINEEDRTKLEILIKPLFGNNGAVNKDSGDKKDIILDIGFHYLTGDTSVSLNYEYSNTLVLTEVGRITKREVNFSFDVTDALSKRETIENAVRKALGIPDGQPVSEIDYQKAYAVLSAFYPEEQIVRFEMAYGSALYDIKSNRDIIFGIYERDLNNDIIYEQAYTFVRGQVNGSNTDFFGNYYYQKQYLTDSAGLPIMVPKISSEYSYFVYGEDPYNHLVEPAGFDWNGVVDYSFLAIVSGDSMQVSRYTYNKATDSWSATWLSEGQSNVQRITSINENTPPSGDNPGIMIRLMPNFESENYIFKYLESDKASRAYITVSKRNPVWTISERQITNYVGKENTNLTYKLYKTEPREIDFQSNAAYLEALGYYRQYAELLKVNLEGHMEKDQILGVGGPGLDIEIVKYGFPGQPYYDLSYYYGKDWTAFGVNSTAWIADMENNGTIKYAGTYMLRVSLPETDTYKASPAVEVLLTVERATVEVYLSPTQRDFNSDNPSVEYVGDIKTGDALFNPSYWGWAMFSDNYRNYLSTITYKFFSQYEGQTINLYETPYDIISQGMFGFDFCSVLYADNGVEIDQSFQVGYYLIYASGGRSFNYVFDISRPGEMSILQIREDITINFDGTGDDVIFTLNREDAPGSEQIKIVELEYNAGVTNRVFVRRTEENQDDPMAIFNFNALGAEADAILSRPVGYLSIEEGDIYQYFRNHFGAKVGVDGGVVLREDGFTQLGFFPIIQGAGYKDLTPDDIFKNASNSGYYIIELYAKSEDLVNYKDPYSVYVFLKINQSDMIINTHEEGMQVGYTGAEFIIRQSSEDLGDMYSFFTNNLEIAKYLKIYKGSNFIRSGSIITSLTDEQVMRETDGEGNPLVMTSYEFSNTGIIDAGFYRIEITFIYLESTPVKNYRLPDPPKASIFVEITKSEIVLLFGNDEGLENWTYTGLPYELKERGTDSSEMEQGFTYETIPGLRIVTDVNGNITDRYYEIFINDITRFYYKVNFKRTAPYTFTFDAQNQPIFEDGEGEFLNGLPTDAGTYLVVMWANAGESKNYTSSRPVAQYYTIKKAEVFLSVEGKEKPDGSGERYQSGKVYGEDNPEDNLQVVYRGWVNGEDPALVGTGKYPKGYTPAWINWNGIEKYTSAGLYEIFAEGSGADNYEYIRGGILFEIDRAQPQVFKNESYATMTYTGTDHRNLSTFTPLVSESDVIYESWTSGLLNFAFYLNYNPKETSMEINLVGRRAADGSIQPADGCVDAGIYVFSISVNQSANYYPYPATQFEYTITKAVLTATIGNNQMTYGEEYPAFDVIYSGFVGKDAIGLTGTNNPTYSISLDGTAVLKAGLDIAALGEIAHVALNIPSNAIDYIEGGYSIGLYNGSTKNYIIKGENASANLMINRRELQVTGSSVLITKQYDKNIYSKDAAGASIIRKEHYVFINLIRHPLKAEIDMVNLTFNAIFNDEKVGSNKVVIFNELYIDNNNYNLTTTSFEASGVIYKANPNITLTDKTYTYDGTQKAMTATVRGVRLGENVYETVNYTVTYMGLQGLIYNSSEPPKNAGRYSVTVTTNDANYETISIFAYLTIERAEVTINMNGDTTQTYGSVTGLSAQVKGLMGFTETVRIEYKLNSTPVTNIARANVGSYIAEAVFDGTTNYKPKKVSSIFNIVPKSVNAVFQKVENFTYDGKMKQQYATFIDVDNLTAYTGMIYYKVTPQGNIALNFDGTVVNTGIAPKNAGEYLAVAVPPNANYTLVGELEARFTIFKRELTIGVSDMVVDENDIPVFSYINTGIASGETEMSLDTPPSIQHFNVSQQRYVPGVPTEPGVYDVLPYGAEDTDYIITYAGGKLTINKTRIVVNTKSPSGLVIDGSFSPDAEFKVVVVQNSNFSSAKNSYNIFKQNNADYENTVLGEVYEISVRNGEIADTLTLRLKLDGEILDVSEYKIALIKNTGEVVILSADRIEDGYLIFQTNELGSFALLTEETKAQSNIWLYVAIAVAGLFIMGTIILISKRA